MPEAPPIPPVTLLLHLKAGAVGVLVAPAEASAVFPWVAHVLETSLLPHTIRVLCTHRIEGDITQGISKSVTTR